MSTYTFGKNHPVVFVKLVLLLLSTLHNINEYTIFKMFCSLESERFNMLVPTCISYTFLCAHYDYKNTVSGIPPDIH
jgi:hypothetical protein